MKTTDVTITTEFIRLDVFLKLCHVVRSGGEAKVQIQQGQWLVNGEVCTMRGKKLTDGSCVSSPLFPQEAWKVTQA